MDPQLADFLNVHKPEFVETVKWSDLRLQVTTFVSEDLPPLDYVSSVRAMVTNEEREVLMCTSADGETHIVPGGRREAGETLEETLKREILEETGWHVEIGRQIGFWWFHHLTPKPEGYRYPYPDFLQIVHHATAIRHAGDEAVQDDYERSIGFVSYEQVVATEFETAGQRVLFKTVLDCK